jgi:hypothetical protein
MGEEQGTKLAKAVGQRRSQSDHRGEPLTRSATVSHSHSGAVTRPAHAARLGRPGDLQAALFCCQHGCHARGQLPARDDESGTSALATAAPGRPWTTCPLLRVCCQRPWIHERPGWRGVCKQLQGFRVHSHAVTAAGCGSKTEHVSDLWHQMMMQVQGSGLSSDAGTPRGRLGTSARGPSRHVRRAISPRERARPPGRRTGHGVEQACFPGTARSL